MLERTAHRGPDGRGFHVWPEGQPLVALGHARLAIVDPVGGAQPLADESGSTWAVVNGEIYNHRELRRELEAAGHRLVTGSDAEVVVHLLEPLGTVADGADGGVPPAAARAVARLDGMFAAAVWRREPGGGGWLVLARDPLGIRPLYWGEQDGAVYFASEMKGVRLACRSYRPLLPGHVAVWRIGGDGDIRGRWMGPYADLPWFATPPQAAAGGPGPAGEEMAAEPAVARLEALLRRAVARRLMADVPVGVLLSGGVDSTLVAALARQHAGEPLHSFAVGTADSPDLEVSVQAARHLGLRHHVRRYGLREARSVLPRVIYHLESFDAPLVRSALANYLCFELASDYVKVTLTGEGSDEVFGGYASLRGLDGQKLQQELCRLLAGLHHTNLQRADRMGLAHGVEARVPFLDLEVVRWGLGLPPQLKRRPLRGGGEQDKWVVRALAARWVPPELAWRPKAKFSEGSGAIGVLRELASERITDGEWARLARVFSDLPLASREQALYLRLFLDYFPEEAARQAVGITRSVVPGEVA